MAVKWKEEWKGGEEEKGGKEGGGCAPAEVFKSWRL